MAGPVGQFPTGADLSDFAQSEGVSGVGTFEYNRSQGSRVYNFADETGALGGTATAFRYVEDILGAPSIGEDLASHHWIKRKTPHGMSRFTRPSDDAKFLYATKVNLKGLGVRAYSTTLDGLKWPEYKQYRLETQYETLPYEILTDAEMVAKGYTDANGNPDEASWKRYISKIATPAGQFFTIATGSYSYVGGGGLVTAGLSKILSFCNLQITHHQVPERAVPSIFVNPALTTRSYIESTIGCVNSVVFNGYAVGTLLLLGVQMMPYRSPLGDRVYDVKHMMKYFEPTTAKGHNYVYRPSSAAYIEVTSTGATNVVAQTDGISIYNWAPFAPLFRVP